MSNGSELAGLRSELANTQARQRELARLLSIYMSEAGLEREERVDRARSYADLALAVVGGTSAPTGELQDCAAVGRSDYVGYYCSGCLVDRRLVVTAAHCGPPSSTVPNSVALRLDSTQDLAGADVRSALFDAHPDFVPDGPNDIAAMVLDQASAVEPVEMASTEELEAASVVLLAGFGDDAPSGGSGFGTKRQATVPIQFLAGGPSDTSSNPFRNGDFDRQLEFLVGIDGIGACFGDSGGPAYIEVRGHRKLAGVVSRPPRLQVPVCNGLTIITRIDVHKTWIESRILG
jgi:secreted trypsin-like serine protease